MPMLLQNGHRSIPPAVGAGVSQRHGADSESRGRTHITSIAVATVFGKKTSPTTCGSFCQIVASVDPRSSKQTEPAEESEAIEATARPLTSQQQPNDGNRT
jgi:hypothetical protein